MVFHLSALGNKDHNKGNTQTNLFVLCIHIHQLSLFYISSCLLSFSCDSTVYKEGDTLTESKGRSF